jgi:hypothetical protein
MFIFLEKIYKQYFKNSYYIQDQLVLKENIDASPSYTLWLCIYNIYRKHGSKKGFQSLTPKHHGQPK